MKQGWNTVKDSPRQKTGPLDTYRNEDVDFESPKKP